MFLSLSIINQIINQDHRPLSSSHSTGHLFSFSGFRIYHSIAPENAANPNALTAMLPGPCFLANNAPVRKPPAIPLYASFFPRSPSIQHSIPANMPPRYPKFFALLNADRPMSLSPCRSCSRTGRSVNGFGVIPSFRFAA